MKSLLFILSTILSSAVCSQISLTISGVVRDGYTKEPIEGCRVLIVNTKLATLTDEHGYFFIQCQNINPTKIQFSRYNYSDHVQTIRNDDLKDDHLVLNINLNFESFLLPDVDISALPEIVWSSDQLHVADFFFSKSNMLLLTYDHELRWKQQHESKITLFNECQLILLDSLQRELHRISLDEPAVSFYKKYPGVLILIARSNIYLINIDHDQITTQLTTKEDFENKFKPIIDTIADKIVITDYTPDYPEFQYEIFDKSDHSKRLIRKMTDEFQMEMFRSEYKYLGPREKLEAFKFELNTGIDKEIVAAYMTGFPNSIYYHPLNTPLLVSNDSILIFDHVHDQLFRYDHHGLATDSTKISYHCVNRPLKWSGQLLKDEMTENIYTTYDRNGFKLLKNIVPGVATEAAEFLLTYKYAEQITIRNNFVYYVYRPFESSQKRFLYREKLTLH